MIFQHTHELVLSGDKTQTRRLVKPGDELHSWWENDRVGFRKAVQMDSGRIRWEVGRTYAVQPGRGQKAIARIRITDIRREPLQAITEAEAEAEGVEPFPCPTCDLIEPMHSFGCLHCGGTRKYHKGAYIELWNHIHTAPGTTWDDNPDVFVLEFELA